MNNFYEEAIAKLNNIDEKNLDRYGKAVLNDVKAALVEFCRDNGEFAQAVAQTDKTFEDCLKACTKDCGNAISDVEVYRRAVAFWFDGATVHFTLTLDLGDGGFSNNSSGSAINLSLDSLFDF